MKKVLRVVFLQNGQLQLTGQNAYFARRTQGNKFITWCRGMCRTEFLASANVALWCVDEEWNKQINQTLPHKCYSTDLSSKCDKQYPRFPFPDWMRHGVIICGQRKEDMLAGVRTASRTSAWCWARWSYCWYWTVCVSCLQNSKFYQRMWHCQAWSISERQKSTGNAPTNNRCIGTSLEKSKFPNKGVASSRQDWDGTSHASIYWGMEGKWWWPVTGGVDKKTLRTSELSSIDILRV